MSAKESLLSAKLREEQQLKDFGQKLSDANDTFNKTKTQADIKAAEKTQTILGLEAKLEQHLATITALEANLAALKD